MIDPLEKLLLKADATAARPADGPADFCTTVRKRAVRRRRRQIGVVSTAAVGLMGGMVFAWVGNARRAPNEPGAMASAVSAAVADSWRAESAALRREADARSRVAHGMARILAQEQSRDAAVLEWFAGAVDPVILARIEIEHAAETLLQKARRLGADADGVDSAQGTYQEIVDLLPNSGPAAVARRWLSENSPG